MIKRKKTKYLLHVLVFASIASALSIGLSVYQRRTMQVRDNDTAINTAAPSILPNGNLSLDGEEYRKTALKAVLTEGTCVRAASGRGVFGTKRTEVVLYAYSIGQYEVTQELFTKVMGINPSAYQTKAALHTGNETAALHPVERITFYEAVAFCNKLSILFGYTPCYSIANIDFAELAYEHIPEMPDALWNAVSCNWSADGFRLPTEAEWEYAARGGQLSGHTVFAGGSELGALAWYGDNSGGKPHETGIKKANTFELYDMNGNVYEWCWDWYVDDAALSSAIPFSGPSAPSMPHRRTKRGGSWLTANPEAFHVHYRSPQLVYERSAICGFRLARSGT